jgi:hypothetical protein
VLIADTGYELYAACETITDLDQLYAELGMADETPDDVMHSVCDPQLPDAGEVWDGVVEKSGEWLEQVRAAFWSAALSGGIGIRSANSAMPNHRLTNASAISGRRANFSREFKFHQPGQMRQSARNTMFIRPWLDNNG